MAIQKRIKAIIQFRRANEAEWIEHDPILHAGEPAYSLDVGRVKIGDGEKHWSEIEYLSGGGHDESFYIEDPVDGQILLYNADTERWQNYKLADENSIIYLDDNGLSLKGYEEAHQGQMLVKDDTEGITWVDPVSDQSLWNAVHEAEESATRAGNSAVVAGNYAGQAIQAQVAVEEKFWYGTMDEYNELESINPSTIYIILHD